MHRAPRGREGEAGHRHVTDARSALAAVGMPAEQCNERSALVLLALLDLGPEKAWADAAAPLIGITPIMEWARERYAKA
jgi:hypothetical protein